jgi:hypothetical protein
MALDTANIRSLLAEANARVVESIDNDAHDQDVIRRYWPEIPRHDLDACVIYLKAYTSAANTEESATIASPMTGTRWARSGTWYGGRIYLDWYTPDGGGQKQLGLFQVLYKGGLTLADNIVKNGCQLRVTSTWYHGQTAIGACPDADPEHGIEYERSEILINSDLGTYSYHIDKIERLYQHIDQYTHIISAARTIKREHHLGVKQGDKDDDGSTIGLQAMTEAVQHKILRLRRSKDPNCTQGVDEEEEEVQNQTIEDKDWNYRRHTTRTINTEADAALAAPEEQQHHLHRHTSEETEAGGFRTTDEDVEVQNQEIVDKDWNYRRHTTRTINTEADAALAAPEEQQHHLHRHTSEETEAGGFRTTDEDVEVQNQEILDKTASAGRTVTRTTHTEADSGLDTPPAEAGHIKRSISEETEAGGYRTTEEDAEYHDLTATGDSTHDRRVDTAHATIEEEQHSAAATALADEDFNEAGTLVETESTQQEHGKYQTRKRTTTLKDWRISVEFETRYGTGYLIRAGNQPLSQLEEDLALCTDGYNPHVSIDENEGELFDYTILLIPHSQSGGSRTFTDYTWSYDVMVKGVAKKRIVDVKWYAANQSSSAKTHIEQSDGPGAGMSPVGCMWKAVKVTDATPT